MLQSFILFEAAMGYSHIGRPDCLHAINIERYKIFTMYSK
jgi:hypothetical protein